jgi:hypothetical protein
LTPLEALQEAAALGVTLSVDRAGQLLAAPRGKLLFPVREALSTHKERVKAALKLRAIHEAMGFGPEDVLFIERALLSGKVSEVRIVARPPEAPQ